MPIAEIHPDAVLREELATQLANARARCRTGVLAALADGERPAAVARRYALTPQAVANIREQAKLQSGGGM